MTATIRTKVKELQAEIMAEFRATALTMREEIVKELHSTMASLQTSVNVHTSKIDALEPLRMRLQIGWWSSRLNALPWLLITLNS